MFKRTPRDGWLVVSLAVAVLGGCQDQDLPTALHQPRPNAPLPAIGVSTAPGSLVSWGREFEGTVSGTPSGTGFIAIAAGAHSVALRQDGSLVAWGYDGAGQVSGTPTGTGFTAVAAGNGHAVAIRQSGYDFSGFFAPVDNLPTVNVTKAGKVIPIRFSLGGNQGLDIFASGYPTSESIACETSASQDAVTETVSAGGSKLSYDPVIDQYTYIWKTEKTWTGCRLFTVRLNDGTEHQAVFNFVK